MARCREMIAALLVAACAAHSTSEMHRLSELLQTKVALVENLEATMAVSARTAGDPGKKKRPSNTPKTHSPTVAQLGSPMKRPTREPTLEASTPNPSWRPTFTPTSAPIGAIADGQLVVEKEEEENTGGREEEPRPEDDEAASKKKKEKDDDDDDKNKPSDEVPPPPPLEFPEAQIDKYAPSPEEAVKKPRLEDDEAGSLEMALEDDKTGSSELTTVVPEEEPQVDDANTPANQENPRPPSADEEATPKEEEKEEPKEPEDEEEEPTKGEEECPPGRSCPCDEALCSNHGQCLVRTDPHTREARRHCRCAGAWRGETCAEGGCESFMSCDACVAAVAQRPVRGPRGGGRRESADFQGGGGSGAKNFYRMSSSNNGGWRRRLLDYAASASAESPYDGRLSGRLGGGSSPPPPPSSSSSSSSSSSPLAGRFGGLDGGARRTQRSWSANGNYDDAKPVCAWTGDRCVDATEGIGSSTCAAAPVEEKTPAVDTTDHLGGQDATFDDAPPKAVASHPGGDKPAHGLDDGPSSRDRSFEPPATPDKVEEEEPPKRAAADGDDDDDDDDDGSSGSVAALLAQLTKDPFGMLKAEPRVQALAALIFLVNLCFIATVVRCLCGRARAAAVARVSTAAKQALKQQELPLLSKDVERGGDDDDGGWGENTGPEVDGGWGEAKSNPPTLSKKQQQQQQKHTASIKLGAGAAAKKGRPLDDKTPASSSSTAVPAKKKKQPSASLSLAKKSDDASPRATKLPVDDDDDDDDDDPWGDADNAPTKPARSPKPAHTKAAGSSAADPRAQRAAERRAELAAKHEERKRAKEASAAPPPPPPPTPLQKLAPGKKQHQQEPPKQHQQQQQQKQHAPKKAPDADEEMFAGMGLTAAPKFASMTQQAPVKFGAARPSQAQGALGGRAAALSRPAPAARPKLPAPASSSAPPKQHKASAPKKVATASDLMDVAAWDEDDLDDILNS